MPVIVISNRYARRERVLAEPEQGERGRAHVGEQRGPVLVLRSEEEGRQVPAPGADPGPRVYQERGRRRPTVEPDHCGVGPHRGDANPRNPSHIDRI